LKNKIIISCSPKDVERIRNGIVRFGQDQAADQHPLSTIAINITSDEEINKALNMFYENAAGDIDISEQLSKMKPDDSVNESPRPTREEEEYDYDLSLQRKITTMDERQNKLMEMVGGLREFRQHTDTRMATYEEKSDRRLKLLEQFVVQIKEANVPCKVISAPGSKDDPLQEYKEGVVDRLQRGMDPEAFIQLEKRIAWMEKDGRDDHLERKRLKREIEHITKVINGLGGSGTIDLLVSHNKRMEDLEQDKAQGVKVDEMFASDRKRIADLEAYAREIGTEKILEERGRFEGRSFGGDLGVRVGKIDDVIKHQADALNTHKIYTAKALQHLEEIQGFTRDELQEAVNKIADLKRNGVVEGLTSEDTDMMILRLAEVERKAGTVWDELHPQDPGRPKGVINELYSLSRTNFMNLTKTITDLDKRHEGHSHTEFGAIDEEIASLNKFANEISGDEGLNAAEKRIDELSDFVREDRLRIDGLKHTNEDQDKRIDAAGGLIGKIQNALAAQEEVQEKRLHTIEEGLKAMSPTNSKKPKK
jgi:hypothetical protein